MGFKQIDQFKFWCHKVLPLVYDDSLSYYELLCKVVNYINNIIENDKALADELAKHDTDIKELKELTNDMQKELDDILSGKAEGLYLNALREYIDTHLEAIVGRVVKFVSFGLSEDGYFTALIPGTWNFIHFDTILDTESELYGHLILNW